MDVELLAYDGMDLMDLVGPYEALLTADRLRTRTGADPLFAPRIVSRTGAAATAYGGAVLQPAGRPSGSAAVFIVPGVIDVDTAIADSALVGAVAAAGESAAITASVCTGAFLLAQAGLLADRAWTTHWEDLPALAARIPGGRLARVVDTGSVVTAGGICSGIDLGLHLVARLADPALARQCARQMDCAWDFYGADDGGTDPVVLERSVAADPATVYRMWTTAAGVRSFLSIDATVDARIGGRYECLFDDDAPTGHRGSEGCRILALEPARMLAFTWNSPPDMPTRGIHTWVVLTLAPDGCGTRVRLAHWGHGTGREWDANRAYFASAWNRVLDRLAAACRSG